MLIGGYDIGPLLLSIAIGLIVTIVLLVVFARTVRRKFPPAISMLVVFFVASWFLFHISDSTHTRGRWLLESKAYKATVQSQPNPSNGGLKHAEWDSWGFAGVGDTVEYVVFDPNDSLGTVAKSHSPGKLSDIPCEVQRVRRLEKYWYTVLFYTDTDWDHCNQ